MAAQDDHGAGDYSRQKDSYPGCLASGYVVAKSANPFLYAKDSPLDIIQAHF